MKTTFARLEKHICEMIRTAGSGHYASSMSALEIMVPLFYEDKISPDQFILSKGHAAPALYAILHDLGYLTAEQLATFRQHGGLPGHPSLDVPGVRASSGSLGMGISKAMGLAWANPETPYHVLVGDGELQEGQNWEAMGALNFSWLPNLTIHIDGNGRQYSSATRYTGMAPSLPWEWHITEWRKSNDYLTARKDRDVSYSFALMSAMEADERIVALSADLERDFNLGYIKRTFPQRYIECGISEQHMVSMANGLALAGRLPICHTFGAFYRRAYDQMYNNCCDGLKIGYVAGLSSPSAVNIGKSHAPSSSLIFSALMVVTSDVKKFFTALQNRSVYLELP